MKKAELTSPRSAVVKAIPPRQEIIDSAGVHALEIRIFKNERFSLLPILRMRSAYNGKNGGFAIVGS